MPCHHLLLPMCLLAPVLTAQQFTSTIAAGNASTDVAGMPPYESAVAVAPTGIMWTAVRDATNTALYLTFSPDGGQTWLGRFDTATATDGYASICNDRDSNLLDVAWYAKDNGSFNNVYFQAFDTLALAWVGTPQLLTTGTSATDQNGVCDIGVSERGAICIALGSNSAPPAPWTSGWAGGLLVRPAGSTTWDPIRQVNVDYTGVYLNMCIVGETVHMSYRSATGGYGIRYRAFDLTTNAFTAAQGVQLDSLTSNVTSIGADSSGGLYILYAKGSASGTGGGEIKLGYAAPGNYSTWTTQTVVTDPDLIHGNIAYFQYSLATTGTDQVWAFYSKLTNETYSNLYGQLFVGGMAVTPEIPFLQSLDSNRYLWVNSVRNGGTAVPPMCVTYSQAAVTVGRQLDFLSLSPVNRSVEYGIGCSGTLAQAPYLHTVGWPNTAPAVTIQLNGAPASVPGMLLFRFTCQRPVDLSAIGMPGCRLELAPAGSSLIMTDPTGTMSLTYTPPAAVPFVGLPFQFQAGVIAPGANAFGVVASNALNLVFE